MAIQFVVEDGSGKSDATSYISVADADQIIENFGLSWVSGVTEDQKKIALNNAARYIDQKYYGGWKGFKGSGTQALQWPRFDVTDDDGWTLATTDIPALLKQAVVQMAVYFNNEGSVFPDADNPGKLKMERIKIDVLEFEEEYLAGTSGSEIAATIDALLSPYLEGKASGMNVEVSRG